MELIELGFDRWFKDQAAETARPEQQFARVTAVDRGSCLVRNEREEIPARVSGKFRYTAKSSAELPCVGDWVCVQYHNSGSTAVIHEVIHRKTFLCRKYAGRTVDIQMIAANIDTAFIVQSCHYDFNIKRLERYLVMANEGHIKPIVILSKIDLITPDEVERRITEIRQSGISYDLIALSCTTGAGVDVIRKHLVPGSTYCLLGSSGVGKTTLINRIIGRDVFDTKAVSGTGEGTHSTARRQLIILDQGAMLIDTPGMRELGIPGAGEGIDDSFSDIVELSLSCRFTNCSHTNIPGCAVLTAMENGELNEDHYRNYLKLRKESEHYQMSYAEKRKKDKTFGRVVRSVMKQMGKYDDDERL
ncbi:MAG: ribosome small subunit-dependent GTPase A [Nitrospirae bacterium]|nr:ribosome small subunit-dependent GTPase A [Nitrospirota bacterium]